MPLSQCSSGKMNMTFSCSDAPTSDSAPSSLPPGHQGPRQSQSPYHQHPPRQPRHRGPGDKARSRRRAARHQEKQRLTLLPNTCSIPSGPVTAFSSPPPHIPVTFPYPPPRLPPDLKVITSSAPHPSPPCTGLPGATPYLPPGLPVTTLPSCPGLPVATLPPHPGFPGEVLPASPGLPVAVSPLGLPVTASCPSSPSSPAKTRSTSRAASTSSLDKKLECPVCYKLVQPRLMANHAKYWHVDSDIGVECPQCEKEFVAHKIFSHMIESHVYKP